MEEDYVMIPGSGTKTVSYTHLLQWSGCFMDSFKDVLEAAQAYCKTQMAEPTYNLYIDGLEPISFEDSSHITLSVRNDFLCKIVTDRYLGLLKEAFKTVLGLSLIHI